jgi:hypothetical protein
MSDTSASPWEDYWARTSRGAIDIEALDDPVAAALRAHWLEQASWLSNCGVVLDVGSGPAVLARMLGRVAATSLVQTTWLCMDRARLSPDALPAGVSLLGGVDFAASQPSGSPVDAIVSNFGLEYVGADAIAPACARWLAPAGRLHAVVHTRDSIIDAASRQSVDDLRWVLVKAGLIERAEELLVAIGTLPSEPLDRMLHGVDQRDAYNRAVNEVKQRMEQRRAVSPVLLETLLAATQFIRRALQGDVSGARVGLAARRQAMTAECGRVQDMCAAACDILALHTLADRLRQAGFEHVSLARIDCPNGRVAAVLDAIRT